MATHSSILAYRIPWTEEPGGLQSMGSQRVGHDWATELNWTQDSGTDSIHVNYDTHSFFRASLVAQMVKNPLPVWETWVWFLGWEDPLEEEMATHSSILAWRIPWTREPVRLGWSDFARTHACLCDSLTSFKYYDSSTVWLSFFFRFNLHIAVLSAEMSLIFLHFHHIQIYICFIFAQKHLLFCFLGKFKWVTKYPNPWK